MGRQRSTAVIAGQDRQCPKAREGDVGETQVIAEQVGAAVGGARVEPIEDSLGLDYSKPIPHTRDYLTILTGLLDGELVTHVGDEYQVKAPV